MNKLKRLCFYPWSYLLLFSPLFLTGCQLNISIPELEEMSPFESSNQASFVMQTLTTGQQAYYQANGRFASSLETLSLDFNIETAEYHYKLITVGDSAQTVVMTASAKTEELPSYAGVVTVGQTEGGVMAFANICQTDEPSTEPPPLATTPIPGEGLKCPPGSSPVR
ncbi:type IV pilin-like G/H family protein [Capilliphycus salinus ALCB114379]|uniref:type IV pilin-like G/H family protein n=1 Tax=Capilliphycus salinus TaxID=2768948 RepID=UPI0039A693BE